jgi:hypothetical protein
MQDGHVVPYASQKIRKHREHYPAYDMELAIVVRTIKIWRYCLTERYVNSIQTIRG